MSLSPDNRSFSESRPKLGIGNLKITTSGSSSRKGSFAEENRSTSPSVFRRPSSASVNYKSSSANSDETWIKISLSTLPLFNGEECSNFEALNELVSLHASQTLAKCASSRSNSISAANSSTLAAGLITAELNELFTTGILTLAEKLQNVNSSLLLEKLNELWTFFFSGGLLASLEAIFFPLRNDVRIRAISVNEEGRTKESSGRVMPRKLLLVAFRDGVLLPNFDRLEDEIYKLEESSRDSSSVSNSKRRQMIYVLASTLTGDERQAAVESLMNMMRGGVRRNPSIKADGVESYEPRTEEEKLESAMESAEVEDYRPRSTTLESNSTGVVDIPRSPATASIFSNLTSPSGKKSKKFQIPLLRRSKGSKGEE